MKNKLLLALLLVFSVGCLCAQNGEDDGEGGAWEWGSDPQRAKETYTIFSDDVRSKNFKGSLEPLNWLLQNTPNLNKSLYQKAVRVYNGLLVDEKDETLKKNYQDKALEMFDLRVKYFGEEADVLNLKGNYAASYWGQRPDKITALYDLYAKIIELNAEKTFARNIQSYMWLVGIMKNNKLKGVDENKVVEIHEKLTGIIEKNLEKGENQEEWEQTLDYVDAQYKTLVTIDCEFIKNKMIPEFEKIDPLNEIYIKELENLVANMLKAECTEDPRFFEFSEKLALKAPTFGRYNFLIRAYISKKDLNKALEYLDKAAPLAESAADRAEVFMTKARIKSQQGNKGGAKADFMQAVSIDGTKAYEAYTAIGDMYLSSGCPGTTLNPDDPAQKDNPCTKKAFAIAAYNMYIRAGNSAKAAQAQAYFPTKTDVFTYSMGGKQVSVGCFVGETVTIPAL